MMMDPWSMKGMMMGGKGMMGAKGKGDKGSGAPTKKVFVGKLQSGVGEEALRAWAEGYGPVQEAKILLDAEGRSRKYGFVTFKDMAAASMVLSNYASNAIEGNWVDCKPACRTVGPKSPQDAGAAPAGPSSPEEVDAFIEANGLDEKAGMCLRELNPMQQGMVLARGDLTQAQNPSSALMMRIKDAKASVGFSPY